MRAEGAKFTNAEIGAYYAQRAPDLKRNTSSEWRGRCPIHHGTRDSFAVNPGTGCWFCHSQCGRGGSMVALEMEVTGSNYKTAKATVCQIVGRMPKSTAHAEWRTVAKYVYTDELGKALSRVIRRQRGEGAEREKSFYQQRYENRHWVKGLSKARRVPYRLHKVVNAKHVFIVEGEKDCDTIRKRFKRVATTNPMDAGKWLPEYNRYFKGKHVTVLPDNDTAGWSHALNVAGSLLPSAASVRIVELPKLPEKGDLTDWVGAGGTREELEGLVGEVPCLDEAGLNKLKETLAPAEKHVAQQFPFRVTADGVFLLKQHAEGDEKIRLASRVDIVAKTRDAANENWGRLLHWKDDEGCDHQWAMPMELLAAEAGAVRARLLSEGLSFITTNLRLRERFY